MKLLFLTDNFPPEVNAPATRTYEHCKQWVEAGVEVTVITCAPNFPQGKVYAGYKNRLWQTEEMDGIRVIRVWTYISANSGFLKRTLDYLSFCFMAFWASLFVKTDLIMATSPQFFTAVGGCLSSIFKRKPWIMEVRDLWPESIRAVGAIPGKEKWLDLLEKVELFLYRNADRIVVVTESFKDNMHKRGINPTRIDIIKNGVMLDNFAPREKDPALFGNLGIADKFVVLYLGTHGMAHKLDFILDCTPYAHQDVHFLFIGGGAEKEKLLEQVEREGYTNVTMLPSIPKSEVAAYLNGCDVTLAPLRKSDAFKKVIPSKIFESAAMRKPILLGVEGESQAIVEQFGAGVCFEPENRKDFLRAVEAIRSSPSLYLDCQRGCDQLARAFDRKKLAAYMLDRLYDVYDHHNSLPARSARIITEEKQ